jgi:hypothetical protein
MDISNTENETIGSSEGGAAMNGYNTEQGYMGWLNGEYVLFASEADYREAIEEE